MGRRVILAALKASLKRDPNLPTLPDHIRRILSLLKDEDVPLPVLSREIE